MVLLDLIGFVISAAIMVKAGEYAVKSLTAIGKNLNIGGFIVSFFLVGLVSAFPEGFVSIISAFEGVPSLGFGALVGSVIADLTLVIGLVAIVARKTKLANGFMYEIWLFGLLSLMLALATDGIVSKIDGLILIGAALLFFYTILQKNHVVDKLMHSDRRHVVKETVIFTISAILVFIGANYVVKYSEGLAIAFGLPLVVIGIIFIALATSLPEAMFAFTAARQKLADVAIGELFGVIVIDGTLLIGLIALIHPIAVPAVELTKIAVFVLTAIALATYFIQSGKVLTWKEGIVMVFFYMLFVITELTSAKLIPA